MILDVAQVPTNRRLTLDDGTISQCVIWGDSTVAYQVDSVACDRRRPTSGITASVNHIMVLKSPT